MTRVVLTIAATVLGAALSAPRVEMAAADTGSLEHLAKPALARNILAARGVRDPATGKDLLVLSNNNEGSGMELILVDVDANTAEVVRAPAGAGAQTIVEIPGNRLALGTFYDGTLLVFDLASRRFVKSVRFPGETYIFQLAVGSDGRLYAGTYPGGKLGALDLSSYALEDLGSPVAPNQYLRHVSAMPDGRLLCCVTSHSQLFDPRTKTFAPVPPQLTGITSGVVWNGFFVSGNRFFRGPDLLPVPVPFSPPPGDQGSWTVHAALTDGDFLFVSQGPKLWRYRKGETEPVLVSSMDMRGGQALASLSDGRVVVVRGQDYFVLADGRTDVEPRPIPGQTSPRAIAFLRVDPSGRVWGGPPYGQTLFSMDPRTHEVANTATISNYGGEVYDVAFLDGVVFSAAYARGEVIRYDPRQPWDQWNGANPRTISDIGARGYYRPTGGLFVGPGRKLYSGWTTATGTDGGAVAVTDPHTGTSEIIENPFGRQQVSGVATDGTLLYVGGGLGGTGRPVDPNESAMLGIIDPTTKHVVWHQAVAGARRIRPLGYDAWTGIVPVLVDTEIRLFNAATRSLTPLPQPSPPVGSWSNAIPGDGTLTFGSGRAVMRLDLRTGALVTLARSNDLPINNVAVAPDGTLYVGIGVDLFAVRGLPE